MSEIADKPRATEARSAFALAVQLHTSGQLEAAVDAYRAILKGYPNAPGCWSNLGAALYKLGRKDEALDVLRRAMRVCPDAVSLHYELGNLLGETGDHEGALERHRAVLAREPKHPGAAESCAVALFRLDRFDQAVEHCRTALRLHGDDASLYDLLGLSLAKLGQHEAAASALGRAVALAPATTRYRMDLYWHALLKLGRYAEGERVLRGIAPRDAGSPDVLTALANALIHQGRLDQGIECCDAALAADPGHLPARRNRAQANFLAGRYAAAWPDYSWPLLRQTLSGAPRLTGRVWKGEVIRGQSMLLCSEQGLGDAIQFARYAPLLAQRGAEVLLCCPPRLTRLLERLPGIARVVPKDRPWPRTDWVCLLMDVPGILGTDLDSIPGECPYLPVRPGPRPLLPPKRQFRIGIVWGGNPRHKADGRRSCGLNDFAPLVELPGTEFVSLQVGRRADELRTSGWEALILDVSDKVGSVEATADALPEIDLVITVDTMLAHLAGALGRSVWTLLAFAADWRWMLDRADTPWYPTMRLFRQPAPGDWASVFREVRRALVAQLRRRNEDHDGRDAPNR